MKCYLPWPCYLPCYLPQPITMRASTFCSHFSSLSYISYSFFLTSCPHTQVPQLVINIQKLTDTQTPLMPLQRAMLMPSPVQKGNTSKGQSGPRFRTPHCSPNSSRASAHASRLDHNQADAGAGTFFHSLFFLLPQFFGR